MDPQLSLGRCLSFINCHITPAAGPGYRAGAVPPRRLVTLSRQAGSGAHAVAEKLAEYLEEVAPREGCHWTIFDRNLVDKMLEDHHLPSRLARFMPEDRISQLSDMIDELFGLHPQSEVLVKQFCETVLRLAELGNVILIGRGAHLITQKLTGAIHVRLVGSLERRIARVQAGLGLGRNEALHQIEAEDSGRERYLKKYFKRDIDDPMLYHMVLNTDRISTDLAARLIGDCLVGLGKGDRNSVAAGR
jgi:cytidylate kinase